MSLHREFRSSFLIVLKHTLNPLIRRIARSSFGPFALVQHVGRRSGKRYETPIIVSPVRDGFVIELTYGYDVDWHKNVLAARGCTLVWHSKKYVINKIEPLDTKIGIAAFAPPLQVVLRLLKRKHYEMMKVQSQNQ